MNIEYLARPEILAMKPYESARSSASADGVLLNANEAPYPLTDEGGGQFPLNRYPDPQPEALAKRLCEMYGVDRSQLLVTRGSDEGIDLLVRVFCSPGEDAIIESPPCFGMYRTAAAIQGAEVIAVDRKPGLSIDTDALRRVIASTTWAKLVFLTSPNNPTGELIKRADLERILRSARGSALVVLDEAYIEFCDAESAAPMVEEWPNLVVLRTLSKAWAAAGLRCGAVIANPAVIDLLKRVMAPYPLTAPAIKSALECTSEQVLQRQRGMLSTIDTEKRRLLAYLEDCEWAGYVWPGEANFVLLRVDDANQLVAHCALNGVKIRNFTTTRYLENCVRISIGTAVDMDALYSALDSYGQEP